MHKNTQHMLVRGFPRVRSLLAQAGTQDNEKDLSYGIHTYIHIHIHTYIHAPYACSWVSTCALSTCPSCGTQDSEKDFSHVCMHAYIYTHTHTYMHTWQHMLDRGFPSASTACPGCGTKGEKDCSCCPFVVSPAGYTKSGEGVCICICMFVCMSACMYACICIYVCMYLVQRKIALAALLLFPRQAAQRGEGVCICICMFVCICMYVCMYVLYVFIHMYVCISVQGQFVLAALLWYGRQAIQRDAKVSVCMYIVYMRTCLCVCMYRYLHAQPVFLQGCTDTDQSMYGVCMYICCIYALTCFKTRSLLIPCVMYVIYIHIHTHAHMH
jgi:hypothetical protein